MTWCSDAVGKMVSRVMEGDDDSCFSKSSTESSSSCGSNEFISCAEEIRQVNIMSRTLQRQMTFIEGNQLKQEREVKTKLNDDTSLLRSGMNDLKNEIDAMKKILSKSILVTPMTKTTTMEKPTEPTTGESNKRLARYRNRTQKKTTSNPTTTTCKSSSRESEGSEGDNYTSRHSDYEYDTTSIEQPPTTILDITASPPYESTGQELVGITSIGSLPDITPPQKLYQYPLVPLVGDAVTQTVDTFVSGSSSELRYHTVSDLESLSSLRSAIHRYKVRCESRIHDVQICLRNLQVEKHVIREKFTAVEAASQESPTDPELKYLIPHTSIIASRLQQKEVKLTETLEKLRSELDNIKEQQAVIDVALASPMPLPPPEV